MNILQAIKDYFAKKQPLQKGFFIYHSPPYSDNQYRLHLRIEPDGNGVLIVNASTILHLNQTATEFAFEMIKGQSDEEIIKKISRRYFAKKSEIRYDYLNFSDRITTLCSTSDLDPVSYLNMERVIPYSNLARPYRIDCALTYRTELGEECVAPTERVQKELSTAEWKIVIEKAFKEGVPHFIFTGGEPTLREDLPELLSFCEDLGLVTGLLSKGSKISDMEYIDELIASGLDHLMVILDPDEEKNNWNALSGILLKDLFTVAHLTVNPGMDVLRIIDKLAELNINGISLSAASLMLVPKLSEYEDYVAAKQIKLIWDIPVPYSAINPIAFELIGEEKRDGAGGAWLYIEPDGDVLPGQGINLVLGNLLSQSLEDIWHNRKRLLDE